MFDAVHCLAVERTAVAAGLQVSGVSAHFDDKVAGFAVPARSELSPARSPLTTATVAVRG